MTEVVFPASVPELTDAHALLRAHEAEDAPRIAEQCQDPESVRWTTVPRPYGDQEAREFLDLIEAKWNDPEGARYWAVTDANEADHPFLGTVDLRPIAPGAAEVGFGLHPDARGRGLMASAVRLACRWWFDAGGTRVHWRAERGNFASWRVAWSCGFRMHATVPDSLLSVHADRAVDAWVGSLGADDVMEASTPWEDPPELTSPDGAVRLRPWRDSDIEAIEEPDPDQPAHVMPARGVLDSATFPEWLLTRRERMASGTMMSWCVADASTDRCLGEALVFSHHGTLDDDTAELGYQVLPSARRRGVATTAARALAAHALASKPHGGMGLRRLVAVTAEDNVGSNRVLDTAGFTIWGTETAADALPDGRTVDAIHWELLADS
jgi:RimJ/RimL family protein N-acetyltransferase